MTRIFDEHAPRDVNIVSRGSSIACCVDVEPPLAEKARHALRMLLLPLRLEPEWVSIDELRGGIYYGRRADPSGAGIVLRADEAAPGFFQAQEPYDAGHAAWFEDPRGRVPVLFTDRSGHPDLVASAFLWLSGWQERAVRRRDVHGRPRYEDSLAATLGVPTTPVVDVYREMLVDRLLAFGRKVERRTWAGRRWVLCPTHDVDYVRKWRPGILYRELVHNLAMNRRRVSLRDRLHRATAVMHQMRSGDPFRRALLRMPEEVARRGGTATYFIKSGGGDPHDVDYRLDRRFIGDRLQELQTRNFEIALHPSYRTPCDRSRLAHEKARLEEAAGRSARSVRQHYLRYDPVRTPQLHDELGFAIDSTLGFRDREGFRRGTCMPFQTFDLERDRPLSTWEMPLILMESTLFNVRGLDPASAREATNALASACLRFGGAFVVLWHNMLGDEIDCPGWMQHFTTTLDDASERGASIASLEQALCSWR